MKMDVYAVPSPLSDSQSPVMVEEQTEYSTKKRKRQLKYLSYLVFVLLTTVVSLSIALAMSKNTSDGAATITWRTDGKTNQKNVCQTAGCAMAAARVLEAMDPAVDPCEDFYEYACGSWMRKHVIPEDQSAQYVFNIVRDKVDVIKKYLTEDETSYQNFPAIQKAKDMFVSCMDTELIESLGHSELIPLLEELGGWPILGSSPGGNWNSSTFDLVQLLIKVNMYYHSPLINIYVFADVRNSSSRILYIDQPSLGLPSRNYYINPELEASRTAYVRLGIETAVEMGADRPQAELDMAQLLHLETGIANISMSMEDRRDMNSLYNKVTLDQLKQQFPEPTPTDSVQFSWSGLAEGLMSTVNISIDGTEPIVVWSQPYFQHLMNTLQKYDKRTIHNYVVWILVKSRLNKLNSRYLDLLTDFYKALYGAGTKPARWKTCLDITGYYFQLSVSHIFVKEAFPGSAKSETLEMIGGIHEAFKTILDTVPWMDEATRTKAKQKADAIKNSIGYPDVLMDEAYLNDFYKDREVSKDKYLWNTLRGLRELVLKDLATLRQQVDKEEWTGDMTAVNAYYSFIRNRIMFPAGILQPPFYDKHQPKSMNYGGIGMIIGHEITHGFDDEGRQFDKNGNLLMWWDEGTIARFKNQTRCIIDQYDNFLVPDVNLTVNGINTQGENVADNGGLRESYMAYRKWVEARGHEEDQLPGVNLNHDQLFFLNFAQVWCGKMRPQYAVYSVNSHVHSPGRFRVIGTLQNMHDFARVFNCSNKSYMNPPKKCTVW